MLYPKHGDPRAHRNWTCNLQYKTVGGCNSYCTKRMVEILSWDNPAINWCRISQPCSLSDSSIVSPAPAVIHNSLRTSWLFEGYMDWSKYVRMHIIHIYIYKYTYKYTCIYIYVYTCKSWLSLSNGHIGRLPLLSDKPIYPWFIGQLPVLNGNSSSLKNQCSSLGIIIPFLWLNTWNRQHQPTKFYPISLSWLGYPLVN